MKTLLVLTMLLVATVCHGATTFVAREVPTAAKLNQAFAEKASLAGAVVFQSVTADSITVSQGITEQSIELSEAAANGINKVIIKPDVALTGDITIVIKDDGLYVNGLQKLSW
ncbi:MAG: hypothetical protein HGA20_14965 [Geobacteraceae bacterium]|nr:hypothetical protein [Geobacteraceae bacterium]